MSESESNTPAEEAMSQEHPEIHPGLRKSLVGYVTSDSMQNTIIVEVRRRVPHPRFKKIVKRTSKFFAHDEKEEAVVGDRVLIEETRPRSKRKCWELKKVLSH